MICDLDDDQRSGRPIRSDSLASHREGVRGDTRHHGRERIPLQKDKEDGQDLEREAAGGQVDHEVRDGREHHRHRQANGDVDEEVAEGVGDHSVGPPAVFPGVD